MHLQEEKLAGEVLYEGKILRLERDNVRLEDGTQAIREVVRHSGGVGILAVTDEEEALMVRQYRYPFAQALLEIPAGKLEPGETPEECGVRELREECGCRAEDFTFMGEIYPTPAYDSEIIRIFCAKGLRFGHRSLDEDEFLDVLRVPIEEAVSMVLRGEIQDSKTQIALLKYALGSET